MAKKSKKDSKSKKNVKQIPAKVGAKAKTKSGDKVEVVLNTVRTVKDARRGKYKPRKKKKNKTESKEQKTALQLLRDKIELEKLEALQKQQIFQPQQRTQNRRSGSDINSFFGKSKSDGTANVVGDLAKQVKALREEIKKKDEVKPVVEKPVSEEPKEEKSEELETTQNEIQRQRIQRGIARRDKEQREKNLQQQIENVEKRQKIEQSRIRVATRKLSKEKTFQFQASSGQAQRDERQKEISKEIKEQKELFSKDNVKPPEPPRKINRTPLSTAVFERDEKLATRRPKSEEINQRSIRTQTEPPQRTARRPDIAEKLREGGIGIQKEERQQRPLFLDDEETANKVFPAKDIVGDLISGAEDRIKRREKEVDDLFSELESAPKKEKVKQADTDNIGFTVEDVERDSDEPDELEAIKVSRREKKSIELEPTDVESDEPDVEDEQDKPAQKRIEEQLSIAENERQVRDLLLAESRKKDLSEVNRKLEVEAQKLIDQKKREKKKARDNLRKREQKEFLDKEVGEIVSGAAQQAEVSRRESASSKLVSDVFKNVTGGQSLAQEIISATQRIPRDQSGKYSEQKSLEKIDNLQYDSFVGSRYRKAYTFEEAQEKINTERDLANLKKNIGSFASFINQADYSKDKVTDDQKKMNKQIEEDIKKARETNMYSGEDIVKLRNLLQRLRDGYKIIKDFESKKKGKELKKESDRETKQERQKRIRSLKLTDARAAEQQEEDDVDLDEI